MLIGIVPSSSYEDCLQECRNVSGCLWFTEYYEENLCGMFETMTEIQDEHCPSCISGKLFQDINTNVLYCCHFFTIGHSGCSLEQEDCGLPGLCEGDLIYLEGDIATERECQVQVHIA